MEIRATELTRPHRSRLMAPGSAVPQTPQTPLTPSRLVSRAERRRRQKEEGRRVLMADDAVQEKGDMWGGGYA